jgi:hypothetical protein
LARSGRARRAFRLTNAYTRNRFPVINLSSVRRAAGMTVGQLTMALCRSIRRVHNGGAHFQFLRA